MSRPRHRAIVELRPSPSERANRNQTNKELLMLFAIRNLGAHLVARMNIRNERGATMVEYGLIVAFIALVVGVAAVLLGDAVSDLFGDTESAVDSASVTDADFVAPAD
jgi:pilus assembly protein Flp/PilA